MLRGEEPPGVWSTGALRGRKTGLAPAAITCIDQNPPPSSTISVHDPLPPYVRLAKRIAMQRQLFLVLLTLLMSAAAVDDGPPPGLTPGSAQRLRSQQRADRDRTRFEEETGGCPRCAPPRAAPPPGPVLTMCVPAACCRPPLPSARRNTPAQPHGAAPHGAAGAVSVALAASCAALPPAGPAAAAGGHGGGPALPPGSPAPTSRACIPAPARRVHAPAARLTVAVARPRGHQPASTTATQHGVDPRHCAGRAPAAAHRQRAAARMGVAHSHFRGLCTCVR